MVLYRSPEQTDLPITIKVSAKFFCIKFTFSGDMVVL